MSVILIVGSQWGDEGKGKIVDILTEYASTIIRYSGGNNAGHTVIVNDRTYILHLIPSGILHKKKMSVIGNGVVIDLSALLTEIDELGALGIEITAENLRISDRAHVIMPYHKVIDRLREKTLNNTSKIGTTGKGIGPTYADKASRSGIRICDISTGNTFKERLFEIISEKQKILTHVYGDRETILDPEQIYHDLIIRYERIKPLVCDTFDIVFDAQKNGSPILLEGAQGHFLDLDHGTYPFVTSTNTTAGGSCSGSGVPPGKISHVLGIVKAYTTRVGFGPFPTELSDETGKRLQQEGREFGATTGRTRRCGWFDAVLAKQSVDLNGINSIALTKLDVLDTFETIKICVGYISKAGKKLNRLPARADDADSVTPVYEDLPGWKTNTSNIDTYESLPKNCRQYINRIAEFLDVSVSIVSLGPDRKQTIMISNPFA